MGCSTTSMALIAGLVVAATSACGTILDISDDAPTTGSPAEDAGAGGNDGGTPSNDGGTSTDARTDDAGLVKGVPVGKLFVELDPSSLRITYPSAPTKPFMLHVTRPAGDATALNVDFTAPPDLVISPIAPITGPLGTATVTAADVNVAPRALVLDLNLSAGGQTAVLHLDVRITREYRSAETRSFSPKNADQTYTITAWGAGGGPLGGTNKGGAGAFVEGDVMVPKNGLVTVYIGSPGSAPTPGSPYGAEGGGGNAPGGGGGGFSAVFLGGTNFGDAQLVAGAGGGAGVPISGTARGGGGGQGGEGSEGGGGGSATVGGGAGTGALPGMKLAGGSGAASQTSSEGGSGGGGGGGYFGGGGGGAASGGGGGGSYLKAGGTIKAGNYTAAGNSSDPRRMSAGDPAMPGAVIIAPK